MNDTASPAAPGFAAYAAFLVSDVVLLTAAWLVYDQAHRPMQLYELSAAALCTAIGAWLGVWPFVLRQRAELAHAERAGLMDAAGRIQQLEEVVNRIERAAGQWQAADEHANRAVQAAREIGDRITAETHGFKVFLEQAQHVERQHLQLEVSKLRRAEGEWLQTTVRILDHVHALFAAAQRSGQARLVEQLAAFQQACRDAARRIGLVQHVAAPATPFDPDVHQLLDPNAALPDQPVVSEVIGPGYTFQGQWLRRIVVRVVTGNGSGSKPVPGDGGAFSTAGRVSVGNEAVTTEPADQSSTGEGRAPAIESSPPAESGPASAPQVEAAVEETPRTNAGAGTPPAAG